MFALTFEITHYIFLKETDDHNFKIINQPRNPIKCFEDFNKRKHFNVVQNKFRITFLSLKYFVSSINFSSVVSS